MSQAIPLFKTFNEDSKDEIFKLDKYVFSYNRDGKTIELIQNYDDTGMSVEASLSDETGFWNPDEYPLHVSRKFKIRKALQLFSSGTPSNDTPFSIACHDAIIGIGLKWYSSSSNQCGAIPVGTINSSTSNKEFLINYNFEKASIRGEVFFKIILYVCKSGKPNEYEKQYGNTPGMILGEIDTFAIRIDGNGSFFPIFEISSPGEPLWDIKCSWADPSSDSFSDCVAIYINKAHKNYKYLNREDKNFNSQLFSEIMSSAICVMVEKLRAEPGGFASLDNAQEGSVAQAVNYFRDKLGWVKDTPELTSKSIRQFLEDKLKKL
jgi:hypothetical protein